MANRMLLSPYSGYPTETAMRVWVEFEVTSAGNYYTYFEVYYKDSGTLVTTAEGSTLAMSAGQVKSDLYKTITGLKSGTNYYIVGSLWNADTGKRLSINEPKLYFTTEGEPTEEFENWLSIIPSDGYPTDVAMRVWVEFQVAEDGKYSTYFELYNEETGTLIQTATGSVYNMDAGEIADNLYKTFTGLEAGTDYYIVAAILNAETGKQLSGTRTVLHFTTENLKPSIRMADCTTGATSVTVSADVTAPKGSYYVLMEIRYLTNFVQRYTTNRFTTSVGLTYTFTDIPSGTDVMAYVYLYDYDTGKLYDDDFADVTTLIPARPKDWSWTSTVASGAEIPYTKSNGIVYCKPLTAAEWNGFVDRIWGFMDYTETVYQVDSSILHVNKGDEMLAEYVEAARQLIESMDPPTSTPSAISANGKIRASFINGLKNSLNSIE